MYSIGEISKMFDLPISTLRYYDKEGLFPHLKRVNGVRKFSENEIETLRVIDCLKRSGLEIKDIKEYHIDTFVIGDDWKGKFDYLKDYCEVVYLDRTEGVSTTKIKKELGLQTPVNGKEQIPTPKNEIKKK